MLGSQIFLSVIILFILLKTFFNFRKENVQNRLFFLIWIVFWLTVLILINFTGILSYFARLLGVGRGVDLAIYTSIIVIFYLLFVFFQKLRELEKKIKIIIRELAIKEKMKYEK